jgi:hypothetical protein
LTADDPPYLEVTWTEGCEKNGYLFTIAGSNTANTWNCDANPVAGGGERIFNVDQSGVIYADGTPLGGEAAS